MKKIKLLFKAIYEKGKQTAILPEANDSFENIILGEGFATRKFDGTACAVINGKFHKRYDAKIGPDGKNKTLPEGFIPCQSPDPVTGHYPGWVAVNAAKNEDKYFTEGLSNYLEKNGSIADGTYELCGPKINGNPEKFDKHVLIRHGQEIFWDVPRDFEGLKEWLREKDIEGLVFYVPIAKIRKKDFFGSR